MRVLQLMTVISFIIAFLSSHHKYRPSLRVLQNCIHQ